jgi:diguanylate cyclase (GGDEF)-like protein
MVSALTTEADGTVWVATRKGLGRIRENRLELLGNQPGAPKELIWAMTSTGPGNLWIGTEGGGLVHYVNGHFVTYTTSEGLSSNAVYSLASNRSGELWIGTSAGVDVYRAGRIQSAFGPASILADTPAFALLEDRDENLWIGGGKRGLCRYSKGALSCEPGDDAGSDLIRTFAEDREGNLWLGGTHRGVWQLRNGKLMTTSGERSANHIRSVAADAAGTIWVGTDGSGVNEVRDGSLVPMPGNDRLPSPFIRAVHPQADGSLWIGTLEGLARAKDGVVRTYGTAEGLTSNIVYALLRVRDGSMWVGTSAGLNRVVGETIETLPFRGDVRALLEDRSGRYWIGRRDGLSCIDKGTVTSCGAPASLQNATIFSFLEAPDGVVWIGTNHGIVRVRGAEFTTYSSRDGLFDDNVFEILQDDHGSFWMSSNRGIWSVPVADFAAFDRKQIPALRSTPYGKSDGMGSTQCNGGSQPAGWKEANGKLWFPTARGAVSVEPGSIRSSTFSPPAVVTKVVVDGVQLDTSALQEVSPDAERFEFHYAGLSFIAPDRVRFRYRLDGFDRDWVDAGTRRVAYYTNLPKGPLRFHVMMSNADGVWSVDQAPIDLFVKPHLYESWWVRGFLALLLFGLAFAGSRWWVRQHRRREAELVRLVGERTEALSEANAALQRLAAVDGLTRIPNRRSLDARMTILWEEHLRRHSSLAVILCDVDDFKRYNDALGHLAGDEALIAVAGAIQATLRRATDFAARYGGEEFVILLSDTTLEQAVRVGQQLLENVRALGIEHPNASAAPIVTLSAGIAVSLPTTETSADDLLQAADEALYRAKAAGRNRLAVSEQRPPIELVS